MNDLRNHTYRRKSEQNDKHFRDAIELAFEAPKKVWNIGTNGNPLVSYIHSVGPNKN